MDDGDSRRLLRSRWVLPALAALVLILVTLGFGSRTSEEIVSTSQLAPELLSLGARLRLASRLARTDRLAEARREAAAVLALAPDLSVRQWVHQTYAGVRRQEEMEEEILILTSLGLPEHGPVRTRTPATR